MSSLWTAFVAGMIDIAVSAVSDLYEDEGGAPSTLHFPRIDEVQADATKLRVDTARVGTTVVINSYTLPEFLPEFAVPDMRKTFGLLGVVLATDKVSCPFCADATSCKLLHNRVALGAGKTRTLWRQHCWRNRVSQMLTCFATRATFVSDTNFVSWTCEMFLKILRNISCVRAARNNVVAFCQGRATSQDTMLPPQCVLVLPGPTFKPQSNGRERAWESLSFYRKVACALINFEDGQNFLIVGKRQILFNGLLYESGRELMGLHLPSLTLKPVWPGP